MNKYDDRRSSFLRNKRIQNLPKFDLANKTIDSGRQTTNYGIDTSGFYSDPGYDFSSEISATRGSILPSTLNQGLGYASNIIGNTIKNYSAGLIFTKEMADKAIENGMARAAAKRMIGSKVGAGMNAVGKAASIIGAAYGTGAMIKNFTDFNDIYNGNDLVNMSGRLQQSAEGVNYTTYNSINNNLLHNLTSQQNKATTMSATMNGMGAGASFGSLFGPVGTGIGAAAGAITGFFGGLIGGGHRRRKQEREAYNTQQTIDGYNTQSESEAASQGLRNKFNATHSLFGADKGKDEYGSVPATKGYGKVWTPAGLEYGRVNSLVGKGESIIDYTRGEASYVDKGTKRVDNQPSIAADGDLIVIAGNKVDPTTGVSYADQVAPMSKEVQKLNKIIKEANPDTPTGKLQIEQANIAKNQHLQNMKNITDRQLLHNMYDDAGVHYDGGKSNWANAIGIVAPYAGMMTAPLEELLHYKGHSLRAENPYVANRNANAALNILSQIGYDPTRALLAINDNSRMSNYAINQSGAYSPGQRMTMLTANNTNRLKAISQEYANAAQMDNQYKSAYAQALMLAGEADRQAAQQALSTQQERRRQAYAQKRKGIESAHLGMINIGTSALKNYYSQLQYNAAREDQLKMLDLYGQLIDIDRYRAMHPNGEAERPTYRGVWTPSLNYNFNTLSFSEKSPLFTQNFLNAPTLSAPSNSWKYGIMPNYKFTI